MPTKEHNTPVHAFQKGHIPWTKGRILTEEHKAKIRASNLGKKRSAESRANMSLARKGVPISLAHRKNIQVAVSAGYRMGTRKVGTTKGYINGNWRGGISVANKTARQLAMQTTEYKYWRKHVFQRDNYTCQACGMQGGKLQADHELPWSMFPDIRFEILNGRTLCEPCHKQTPTYGINSTKLYGYTI